MLDDEKKDKFRMVESEDGRIDAELTEIDGEKCHMCFAKSGRNKYRTVEREGSENACRKLMRRVKGALGKS